MFGEEPHERQLDAQGRRLGRADGVELVDFRDDVEEELERLDVLMHASVSSEPFGMVTPEGRERVFP